MFRLFSSDVENGANVTVIAVNKVSQLYEQKQTAPKRAAALDDYISRWLRWIVAGRDDKSIMAVYAGVILINRLNLVTS